MYHNSYSHFLTDLITFRTCSSYYYIGVYIQITLLIPLICRLAKSKYKMYGLLITPAAIIIEYILIFLNIGLPFPWNANNFAVWFIYFYLGLLLGNAQIEVKLTKIRMAIVYMLAYTIQLMESFYWYRIGNYYMATTQIKLSAMITSIVVIVIIYQYIPIKKNECNRVLTIIGNCSFEIYMSHMFIMELVGKHSAWEKAIFPINTIMLFILSFTLSLIVGKIKNRIR